MEIWPAVDIRGGNAVRLEQGDYARETVFGTPIDFAAKWVQKGARNLHLVDLDGAKQGYPVNTDIVENICSSNHVNIQIGGGLRSESAVQKVLDIGVQRFIIGTSAIRDEKLLRALSDRYGDRLIVSIDARGELLATSGWIEETDIRLFPFLKHLEENGVSNIIYTDIERDGRPTGPNIDMCERILSNTEINLNVAGGISSIDDVLRLKEIGAHGAIIGRAIYTSDIDLTEAIRIGDEG